MSALQSITRRCLRQALANKDTVMIAAGDSLRAMSPASIPCNNGSITMKNVLQRTFATSYLDKSEVTDRVLNVVKNFDKVDTSKVCFSVCPHHERIFMYNAHTKYYIVVDYAIGGVSKRSWVGQLGYRRVGHGH